MKARLFFCYSVSQNSSITGIIHFLFRFSKFNISRIVGSQNHIFGAAVIESSLGLIPSMTQSTLHYSIELITVAIKQFMTTTEGRLPFCGMEVLAVRIAQVSGVKVSIHFQF